MSDHHVEFYRSRIVKNGILVRFLTSFTLNTFRYLKNHQVIFVTMRLRVLAATNKDYDSENILRFLLHDFSRFLSKIALAKE
jgi:hypothetical protein